MAFAWRPEIVRVLHEAADAHALPRELVRAVCYVESRGNPMAVSPVGAQGLMQLMPATAADLGVTDAFDPEQNAHGGARYLAQLIKMLGGDLRKALAAYNWGIGNVQRKPSIPASVQKYASDVLARMEVERAPLPLAQSPARPVEADSRSHACCPRCGWRFVPGGKPHGA